MAKKASLCFWVTLNHDNLLQLAGMHPAVFNSSFLQDLHQVLSEFLSVRGMKRQENTREPPWMKTFTHHRKRTWNPIIELRKMFLY